MAVFDRNDTKPSGPGTVIGSSVKLTGAIKDANDIIIHGSIDGELASDRSITIGETAQVKGPVMGAVVTVAGTIRGSVEAMERLEILPTGKIYGNIATADLIIRSGALFVGKSSMAKETEPEEAEKSVKAEFES